MSSEQLFFIAIAGVLILGALGAFAIAYRRSLSEQDMWESGVSAETRKADKPAPSGARPASIDRRAAVAQW